jgi:2,4-dienoyl-CoA reductase-like NADH-dependent reductase (Old Yellow Enzyme family)
MRANRKQKQPIHPVFSFVVDGKCEYWYLQMLKDNEKSLKVRFSPEIYKKSTLKEQYKRVVELAKDCEKVFWVIDFDVINKETLEAKDGRKTTQQEFQELYNKCKKNNKIAVIVNNPCFEFWFLLHFKQTSKYFSDYSELEKMLKKYLPNYKKTENYFIKTPDIYKRLKNDLPTAIKYSKKTGEFDFNNLYTGIAEMYKIFDELNVGNAK